MLEEKIKISFNLSLTFPETSCYSLLYFKNIICGQSKQLELTSRRAACWENLRRAAARDVHFFLTIIEIISCD